MAIAIPAQPRYVPPTEADFFINAAAAETSWDVIDQQFQLRAQLTSQQRRGLQFPGLNLVADEGHRDSSFVVLGMEGALRGNELAKTIPYDLWTSKTRKLAAAVREAVQALMDKQRESGSEIKVTLTYIVKVLDWLANNKVYLGMLQGWMLVCNIAQTSVAIAMGSQEKHIAIPKGKGTGSDLNPCMLTFLHNTAFALKAHGFEARGGTT